MYESDPFKKRHWAARALSDLGLYIFLFILEVFYHWFEFEKKHPYRAGLIIVIAAALAATLGGITRRNSALRRGN